MERARLGVSPRQARNQASRRRSLWEQEFGRAALIRADSDCCRRVIKSYRLMLRFYGLELVDERTGAVRRDAEVGDAQLQNFNLSAHNWLRISRIITSLGELGFRRYKAPFLRQLRAEIDNGSLANAAQSYEQYWAPLVTGESEGWYADKTLEEPSDREECVLFKEGGALWTADGGEAPVGPA